MKDNNIKERIGISPPPERNILRNYSGYRRIK